MAKQLSNRQKYNGHRRIRAAQDRENRFIVDYLQCKRPDIYQNAKKIYTDLRTKYKGKHDVRKTREYEVITTGTVKKYKYNKYLTINDNMRLTIELTDPPVEGLPLDPPVEGLPRDVPIEGPLLDVPIEGPQLDVPIEGPQLDVPIEGPQLDVPIEGPQLDVPIEGPQLDVPIEGPQLDVPMEGPLLDVPIEGPLFDVPIEGPQLDVPMEGHALSDITADLTLPDMSEETMEQLIEELRQDPTMSTIFDSMNGLYDNIFW